MVNIGNPAKTNMAGWKIHHLKMHFLSKIGIFQCHVSFQGCKSISYMLPIACGL